MAAAASFVTINGHRELFLVYKTQGDPGKSQPVTVRMVRLADTSGTRGGCRHIRQVITGHDYRFPVW